MGKEAFDVPNYPPNEILHEKFVYPELAPEWLEKIKVKGFFGKALYHVLLFFWF